MQAVETEMGFDFGDALDLVNRFGLAAIEGTLIKTLANAKTAAIKRPRGWFMHTLRKRWGWTSEQIDKYIHHEWWLTASRLSASEDPAEQRKGDAIREVLAVPTVPLSEVPEPGGTAT